LYRHGERNEATKEGTLSYVLQAVFRIHRIHQSDVWIRNLHHQATVLWLLLYFYVSKSNKPGISVSGLNVQRTTDEPYPCSKNPGEEAAHKAAGENILSGDVQAGDICLGSKSATVTTNIPNMIMILCKLKQIHLIPSRYATKAKVSTAVL
jgi:hypothetical protein